MEIENHVLIVRRDDGCNTCKGCVMEQWGSYYESIQDLNRDNVIKYASKYLSEYLEDYDYLPEYIISLCFCEDGKLVFINDIKEPYTDSIYAESLIKDILIKTREIVSARELKKSQELDKRRELEKMAKEQGDLAELDRLKAKYEPKFYRI